MAYASKKMLVDETEFWLMFFWLKTTLDGSMNAQMKQTILAKIESYVKRAEEIKEILKKGPTKKKAVADTSNGRANSKDNKGDEDDNTDPDRRRMMQKFEGTLIMIMIIDTLAFVDIFQELLLLILTFHLLMSLD